MNENEVINMLSNRAFSSSEITTIQLLSEDKTQEDIATVMGQSRRTVEARLYKMRKDLMCRTNIGLVIFFFKNGLIK